MNNVEKYVKNFAEKSWKKYGKVLVENSKKVAFTQNYRECGKVLHRFIAKFYTTKNSLLYLLNSSYTHYPHSLLLLLLNY